ncbi:MAG: potassium transporter TrkG [Chloroflexota bacterium]
MRGARPGDVRVRIPSAARTSSEHLEPLRPWRRRTSPGLLLIYGFLILILVGTALLALPISTQDRSWTALADALFTATSAVCVTGLTVVDTAHHWSAFGQVVILLLVQAGGFGIMAGSTLIVLLLRGRRRVGLADRIAVQQTTGELRLGGVLGVVRNVALFSLGLEAVGAVVLALGFTVSGFVDTPLQAAWFGVFHAVSAFNNAGFDLIGPDSLAPVQGEWWILLPLAALILVGSVGFAVVADVTTRRSWRRLTVESRMVLLTTTAIVAIGSLAFLALEWVAPDTLGALPPEQRPLAALFEAVSLRTAGFSTMPVDALAQTTLFVVMAMMFVGGASGSTAGGIKVTTFSVLFASILATARGDSSPSAFGRRFGTDLVYRALTVALLAIAFLFVTALLLNVFTPASFVHVLFESTSALATAGGSTGVTGSADTVGRLVIIAAMFIGRLGPLTLVLVLTARARPAPYRHALETIRIG